VRLHRNFGAIVHDFFSKSEKQKFPLIEKRHALLMVNDAAFTVVVSALKAKKVQRNRSSRLINGSGK